VASREDDEEAKFVPLPQAARRKPIEKFKRRLVFRTMFLILFAFMDDAKKVIQLRVDSKSILILTKRDHSTLL
jgi:hypothetical protein